MDANNTPTVFTDEKLNRLTEHVAEYRADGIPYGDGLVDREDIEGLLERLRWAEKCAELCATDENCCNIPELGENDTSPYYLWKRAAGKE